MGGHVSLRDRVGTARGTVLHERLWRLAAMASFLAARVFRLPGSTVKGKLFHARSAFRLKLTNRLYGWVCLPRPILDAMLQRFPLQQLDAG
jgi:hypothetical protein